MLQVETTSRRVQLPAADEGQERLPAHERRGQRTKVPASGWRRGGNSALASLAEFKEKPLATPTYRRLPKEKPTGEPATRYRPFKS